MEAGTHQTARAKGGLWPPRPFPAVPTASHTLWLTSLCSAVSFFEGDHEGKGFGLLYSLLCSQNLRPGLDISEHTVHGTSLAVGHARCNLNYIHSSVLTLASFKWQAKNQICQQFVLDSENVILMMN